MKTQEWHHPKSEAISTMREQCGMRLDGKEIHVKHIVTYKDSNGAQQSAMFDNTIIMDLDEKTLLLEACKTELIKLQAKIRKSISRVEAARWNGQEILATKLMEREKGTRRQKSAEELMQDMGEQEKLMLMIKTAEAMGDKDIEGMLRKRLDAIRANAA